VIFSHNPARRFVLLCNPFSSFFIVFVFSRGEVNTRNYTVTIYFITTLLTIYFITTLLTPTIEAATTTLTATATTKTKTLTTVTTKSGTTVIT